MRIGPFTITRSSPAPQTVVKAAPTQSFVTQWPSPPSAVGWWPFIRESFAGAWQRGIEINVPDVLSHSTVFACGTLIASDISKSCFDLVERDQDDITSPVEAAAFSPVLRKPNHYQNRIQFFESWVLSKVFRGNAYVLKARDGRKVVQSLYILDPLRVTPLVGPSGNIYYQIGQDVLSGIDSASVVVPASEIIHDRWNTLYHPLVGLSPIHACGFAAMQGLKMQRASANLFDNGTHIGGVLTAPGTISNETAMRIQKNWEDNYAGPANVGKVAVLGDGLHFDVQKTMSYVDAQLIEQLKWSDEKICSTHHVPPYMVGVGPPPNYNNIEALNQQYYSQCLQNLIESIELCLEEGIDVLPSGYEIEYDLDGLLRMDSATKMKEATDGVKGGIYTPNDGQKKFNKKPLEGGDTVYLQQQYFSIQALARRDAMEPAPAQPITAPVASKLAIEVSTKAASKDEAFDEEAFAVAFAEAMAA